MMSPRLSAPAGPADSSKMAQAWCCKAGKTGRAAMFAGRNGGYAVLVLHLLHRQIVCAQLPSRFGCSSVSWPPAF